MTIPKSVIRPAIEVRRAGGEIWNKEIERWVRSILGNGPISIKKSGYGDYFYEQIPSDN